MPGGVKFYLENDILPAYSNRPVFIHPGEIIELAEGSEFHTGPGLVYVKALYAVCYMHRIGDYIVGSDIGIWQRTLCYVCILLYSFHYQHTIYLFKDLHQNHCLITIWGTDLQNQGQN